MSQDDTRYQIPRPLTPEAYQRLYDLSIREPAAFWGAQGRYWLDWQTPFSDVISGDFHTPPVQWFADGALNASVNCLDRHLPEKAQDTALIWEGDNPDQQQTLTYQALYEAVCRLANGLKSLGVDKGDRVCIYLPLIPEAVIAMLACARIGAVHTVVFAGFSPSALKARVQDAECKVIITADSFARGGRSVALKSNVDSIIEDCPSVAHVIVVALAGSTPMSERDVDYHTLVATQAPSCEPAIMNACDPLFILYTSGSTGKPKGVLHGTGGYLLYATMTFATVFDYQPGEVYWCTADVGWITGHSYMVYGPLAAGATSLIFGGVPTYPDASRFWQVVERHRVNVFYTAPTAIRALMAAGDEYVTRHDRSSLKCLGTVGEPINPDVWQWYHDVVGEGRCPVVDTWWQTETGGIMISLLPEAMPAKPGAATKPFFGILPQLVDEAGAVQEGETDGKLVIAAPWPGQLQALYGDEPRFIETYLAAYPGCYFTGDGAHRDEAGDFWITGRVDDVINVSGHRLGSAEIENVLVAHPDVAEAAVVPVPHEVKGQGIFAFVTVMQGHEADDLPARLQSWVRQELSPIATPERIVLSPELPKTRSGKIMRRILRKLAAGEREAFGDVSTLADSSVIERLLSRLHEGQ